MSKINEILTAEREAELLRPLDENVGAIHKEIDEYRLDGTA